MEPPAIADLIRRSGGVVRGRSLAKKGVTRGHLARAVHAGAIYRVRSGVYRTADAAPDIVTAAAHGGELACTTVLRRHGIWVLTEPETHVWLGANGRAHPHENCRCTAHRDAGSAAFGVVSVVQALVQAASCQSAECFFAAYESAWHLGMLTRADRAEIRARIPAGRRWLVDFARDDADSGLESLLRLRLALLGISLECQVWIGGVGLVDFVVGGTLILEVDGRENHDGPSKRHKDLVRDAEAAALGYETLRFDYALVVHDWERVARAILSRLRTHRS